ncbi:Regulatory protein AsnC [archaeon HR05]|nr:Regulatory protein AsnC [archaeon HR04]GBC74194.1 Regulatory protein AsnC [archaeon HR05]
MLKRRGRKPRLLDEIDKSILSILHEDCLIPFVKIAKALNVNEGTIRHRVKRLVRSGIIKKFTIKVDPIMLGLGTLVLVIVVVSPGNVKYVAQELAKVPNVLEVLEVHTYGDLLLKVRGSNMQEIASILANQIKTIEGVISTQVISVLNVWKDEHPLFLR